MPLGLRAETRRCEDRELRRELSEIAGWRDDEEISDEEVLPGELLNEADRQAVLRVGAGVQVLDEQLAIGQMREHVAFQQLEARDVKWSVDFAPGDVPFARGLLHHEFVVG